MKYLKKTSKQKRTATFIASITLILAIIAAAFLVHMKQEKNQPSSSQFKSQQQSELSGNGQGLSDSKNMSVVDNEVSTVFEEDALESVMADGVVISTPIGELYYSKAWEEYTEVKCSSDETHFTAVIHANIGNHSMDILAIHLCDEADGMTVGSVPDSDGNQTKVFLEIYEIDTDNGWSQSEIDTVYAMQESVNQLVEQIKQLYGYVPA